jgi:DNA-binding transcriptional LysR family regulator
MEWSERIGRRLKLRDLHILLAVAQCKSIAKAADLLAISQPVVSKAIADLERMLDVRLVDRDRHGAEPTIYGEALLKRGLAAFDELRQGVKDVELLIDPTAGRLRIGTSVGMDAGLIPAIVDRLSRQYPRMSFDVTLFLNTLLLQELRARNFDLVVGRWPRSLAEPDVNLEILYDEPVFVVADRKNVWARRRRIELAEIIDEKWIFPAPDHPVFNVAADAFRAQRLEMPRAVVTSTSLPMDFAMLATGRFLAVFSRSVVQFAAERLSLKVLPVNLSAKSTTIGIVTLKNRTLNPLTNLFIQCARDLTKSFAVTSPVKPRKRRTRGIDS